MKKQVKVDSFLKSAICPIGLSDTVSDGARKNSNSEYWNGEKLKIWQRMYELIQVWSFWKPICPRMLHVKEPK